MRPSLAYNVIAGRGPGVSEVLQYGFDPLLVPFLGSDLLRCRQALCVKLLIQSTGEEMLAIRVLANEAIRGSKRQADGICRTMFRCHGGEVVRKDRLARCGEQRKQGATQWG